MASQVWPGSLPQSPLINGYEEQPVKKTKKTEMDQGPPKSRKKITAKPKPYKMKFKMTGEQVKTLFDFYQQTLEGGSKKFDFKDPRTQNTKEFRFKEEPPGAKPLSPDLFEIDIVLEKMP